MHLCVDNLIANLYADKLQSVDKNSDDEFLQVVVDNLKILSKLFYSSDAILQQKKQTCNFETENDQFFFFWIWITKTYNETINAQTSISDLCMLTFANMICAKSLNNRKLTGPGAIVDLKLDLIQLSERHTRVFPDGFEISQKRCAMMQNYQQIFDKICNFLCQHYRHGSLAFYLETTQKPLQDDQNEDEEMMPTKRFPITNQQLQRYRSFMYQPLDSSEREMKKLDECFNLGFLLKNNTRNLIMDLNAVANRVFVCLKLQSLLLDQYPVVTARLTTQHHTHNFLKNIRNKPNIANNDDFMAKMLNVVFEYCLPLGSSVQLQRNSATKDDKLSAIQMCERELGVDLVEQIRDMHGVINAKDIAQDPKHVLYEPILLCIFEFWFQQAIKVSWISKCYISENQQILKYDKFFHPKNNPCRIFEAVSANVCVEDQSDVVRHYVDSLHILQTPICTNLYNTWYCYFDFKWYECDDLLQCLLTWCVIMRKWCRSELDTQISCGQFIDSMIN